MSIIGVQDFYYNVENMDRAVKFYTEILGCKLIDSNPWWSSLDCYGLRLGLHGEGPDSKAVPYIPRDSHGSHAGGTLTLKSNDIYSDRTRLVKNNVKILGDIDEAWGILVVFEDSEGNVLKLMQVT